MDPRTFAKPTAPALSPGMDHTEEVLAEVDEPPLQHIPFWSPPKLATTSTYCKAMPPACARRESLLTRQLHSETEHSDEDRVKSPLRGMSTVSTWSNPSTASTADLTSDDGHSVPSPTISPPLPPTRFRNTLPISDKALTTEPKILALHEPATEPAKDPVEAGLGRKRCITFACGNKEKPAAPTTPQPAPTVVETTQAASPPKRKCSLKFVCPSKPTAGSKPTISTASSKRSGSPPPTHRRSSSSSKGGKLRRGSDSTLHPSSPRLIRKSPTIAEKGDGTTESKPVPANKPASSSQLDDSDDDSGAEATRFHEFGASEDEQDEWVQESGCYRSRLTVSDTLKKENVIRQLVEEVEEEVLEEDEDEDVIDDEDAEDDDEDDNDIVADDAEHDLSDEDADDDDDESDAGFHSDDEEGFAVSDSDDDDGSDNEWWTPGGLSTAATSAEHLEILASQLKGQRTHSASSFGSMSSGRHSPVSAHPRRHFRTHSKSSALPIGRPTTPDLPDSTDFVCGTLDEDRPREQAYLNLMKEREAAKHRPVPQDIDPSFPTSDPEMDEEDEEDLEDPQSSSAEAMMHGSIDEIHGTVRRPSPVPRRNSTRQRSPLPAARHRSPAPVALRTKSPAPAAKRAKSPAPVAKRAKSPAPVAKRAKSPAPVAKRAKSPAPVAKRAKSPAPVAIRSKSPTPRARPINRSPPPTAARAHSPTPRRLFGHSPKRFRSPPPPGQRMTSPPNTRRASPSDHTPLAGHYLAQRPNTLTVASSLPKRPGGFLLSRLGGINASDVESSDTAGPHTQRGGRRRGAIDIVKGLEKKKQRRKEKLCQKLAAKAAVRGEERRKVKPGRGAERMREVGLEMKKYKGNGNHILSF